MLTVMSVFFFWGLFPGFSSGLWSSPSHVELVFQCCMVPLFFNPVQVRGKSKSGVWWDLACAFTDA